MKTSSYTAAQKFLHWLSAVIIIWALGSGFYVSLFEVALPIKQWIAFFNVSLTTVFIPFFLVRLALAFQRRPVSVPCNASKVERLAALVHGAMYGVVSVVLVTGVLMMDRPITVFDLVFIPQPLDDPYWLQLFLSLHIWACLLLAGLLVLHVAAVLKHEVTGQRVLLNMGFGR
ncbi:cytochrome b561 [Pseudomonas sp. ok272]|nr:cytochrome b561 [Pseudomonas sp. ok272]SFM84615.1 cytochrome b561 [Pseudomonas sp. ok602]